VKDSEPRLAIVCPTIAVDKDGELDIGIVAEQQVSSLACQGSRNFR
jgi:hypothetical protein